MMTKIQNTKIIEEINEDAKESKKLNKIVKILSNVGFSIFMIIMVILILITAQAKITSKEPGLFGHRLYIVDSGSMSPTIKEDSMIIVKELEFVGIQERDIVTYYGHGGSRVTHRVMKVENNGKSFTTRGDANNSNDPLPLEGEKIIGKVVFIIPFIGNVFRILSTKLGIALLITISITWIALPKLLGNKVINKNR